jgi:hypothetical protein
MAVGEPAQRAPITMASNIVFLSGIVHNQLRGILSRIGSRITHPLLQNGCSRRFLRCQSRKTAAVLRSEPETAFEK